jgi:predicted metal-dependent hydrolase
MEDAIRAGVAVYNAGEYHAAHDAWEDIWLDLPSGTDDERVLHGLIQFTAAVYHAHNGNWSGATGLAESAREYLAGLPDVYRGVDIAPARAFLEELHASPEQVGIASPAPLTVDGEALEPADLDVPALGVAASVLTEEYGHDESVVERAVELAEAGDARSVELLQAFALETENRDDVFDRLERHVEQRGRCADETSGEGASDDENRGS